MALLNIVLYYYYRPCNQQCCYNFMTWSLDTSLMWGATSQFLRYHPVRQQQHRISDTDPRTWCCDNSDNCHKYHVVRPIDTCRYYRPPLLGRFFARILRRTQDLFLMDTDVDNYDIIHLSVNCFFFS